VLSRLPCSGHVPKDNIEVYFINKTFVNQQIISDSIKHSLCTGTGYSFDITVCNKIMDADSN
jgi:hypothetical protein